MLHPSVVDFVDDICENYWHSFTWTSGGCFAFAEAMVLAFPDAELWVVATREKRDWASQHAFAKYKGRYYDATGEVVEKFLLSNYHGEKIGEVSSWDTKNEFPLWYPSQEFVKNEEIQILANLLNP
jgi:hypothetical protein